VLNVPLLSVILSIVLTLLGLVRSEYFPWPDFVHTNHGFPIFWLTHQTSAISGPVDLWFFDFFGFLITIIFWFIIALLSLWIYRKIK
jgi:hypothetical protein